MSEIGLSYGVDTVVIYHSRCCDGIVAAWAFSKSQNFGNVVYHGTNERDFYKDEKMPNLEGKSVYIVDYCYPPSVLEEIKRKVLFSKGYRPPQIGYNGI